MLQGILIKLEEAEQHFRDGKTKDGREALSYAIGQLESYLIEQPKKTKADSTNLLKYLETNAPSIYVFAEKAEKNGR